MARMWIWKYAGCSWLFWWYFHRTLDLLFIDKKLYLIEAKIQFDIINETKIC